MNESKTKQPEVSGPAKLGVEGYLSSWVADAGSNIAVHLNTVNPKAEQPLQVALTLCDLSSNDRKVVDGSDTVSALVQPQVTRRGAFYEAAGSEADGSEVEGLSSEDNKASGPTPGRSVFAFVYPTVASGETQSVVCWEGPQGRSALVLDPNGHAAWASPTHSVTSTTRLELHLWHLVVVTIEETGATLTHQPVVNPYNSRRSGHLVSTAQHTAHSSSASTATQPGAGEDPAAGLSGTCVRIGAAGSGAQVDWAFTGKIGPVGLSEGAVDIATLALALAPTEPSTKTLSFWDARHLPATPGVDMTTDLVDRGPNQLHLSAVNSPIASVTGPNWTGESDQPSLVPDQYCARRYDAQAVTDCRWEVAGSLSVPASCGSGIYAVRVASSSGVTYLPLVVSPTPRTRRPTDTLLSRFGLGSKAQAGVADVAIVLPTLTYMAEGARRPATSHAGAHTPLIPQGNSACADYGGSTLDLGADGAGVCIGSRLRPLAEFGPDARSFDTPGLGRFAQDLGLFRFLRDEGIAVDVLTDEDLDRHGPAALDGYRVVLTGSYPAYASRRTLSAWENYAAFGGRVIYLGAGGFYWLASFNAERTMVEVRRGESGSRTWQADPGEYDHMFEAERCGLWRTKGRAPQKVFGVGFAADGRSKGVGYERMPDSFHKSVAWVFNDVPGGVIGAPTQVAPLGAAALEADRYDHLLGSPSHARILAAATQLPEDYLKAVEEVLFNHPGLTGNQDADVRADMVLFSTPSGGAMFSVGSSAWTLGLHGDTKDLAVKTLTLNVLRAFMASGRLKGQRFDDEDDLVAPGRTV